MPLPSILYLTPGHFVVLKKIKRKKGKYYYYLLDPNYGKVRISENELSERWLIAGKGIGVILKPQDNFEKINIEKNNPGKNTYTVVRFIKTTISKFKKNFIWIFLLTLVVLVTNWSLPLLLQKTIDDGIMQKDINLVWLLLLSQFLFFIGYMLSDNIADLITAKTSLKINIDFITTYLKKIIKLPVSVFDVSFRSDLIQHLKMQSIVGLIIKRNSSEALSFCALKIFKSLYSSFESFTIAPPLIISLHKPGATFFSESGDNEYNKRSKLFLNTINSSVNPLYNKLNLSFNGSIEL